MPHFEELFAQVHETPAGSAVWGTITGTLSDQADLQAVLDGKLDASSYTAADVLAKMLTVDGDGSGLDADLLDGQHGAYYLDPANLSAAVPITKGGTGATSAGAARTALGLAIGSDVQAYDPELAALAGLASAADTLPYFTGSATAALTTFTAFARTLLDDVDASAMRTTLGLVIGTNVQAQDAELQALAGLASAADQLPYFTGVGTAALTTLTAFGRSLIDDTNSTGARATLGLVIGTDVQAQDTELQALASLTSAADRLPYFTGSGTAALATFTAAARTLVADATAADMRTTLGLVIGTNVQAQDAELQAIAGLVSAADRLPYFTGSGTASLANFTAGGRALVASAGTANTFPYFSAAKTVTLGSITAAGRALIDDADAAAQRTTLGLGTMATETAANYALLAGATFSGAVLVNSTLEATGLATLPSINTSGALQATKSAATAITPNWQINGTSAAASAQGWNRWTADANGVNNVYSKSRAAAIGTHTVVQNGDIIGRIGFAGSDGAAFFEAARIQGAVSGTPATGSVPGALSFYTTAAGGGSASVALTLNNDQSATFASSVDVAGLITGTNIYNTYTPTLTGVTNVSTTSANLSAWIRVGNAVLVFTRLSVAATATNTVTEVRCSLPVASNFGSAIQCVGAGAIMQNVVEVAAVGVQADAANDEALFRFVSTSTSSRIYTVVFGYIVI